MMTARQAEQCARIAWDAFIKLTSSEVAAQETMSATPRDFERYALRYLTEAFLIGRAHKLPRRIDATQGHSGEDQTGDYQFPEPPQDMSYVQALTGLQERVPLEYRQKFKRLHAAGATPRDAYVQIMAEWDASSASVFRKDETEILRN
jgi:hypothetical protein